MCSKNFVKRVVPFFLTFAVGLFIASFFVSIVAPSFRFNNRFRRHQEYHRMMEFENQRLRERNSQLEKQLADSETESSVMSLYSAVPPPPMPPMPPPAPVRTYRR
jgi:hypothetical protein